MATPTAGRMHNLWEHEHVLRWGQRRGFFDVHWPRPATAVFPGFSAIRGLDSPWADAPLGRTVAQFPRYAVIVQASGPRRALNPGSRPPR